MSVLFPSSTLPAVLNRRRSIVAWLTCRSLASLGMTRRRASEVALLLAVFHRGLGALVVVASAAFGGTGRGDFLDDLLEVRRGRFHGAGACDVADGAEAHE